VARPFTQGSNPNSDDDSNSVDMSSEFLRLLEATVLDAGKYVIPSDDLRPHTLEAAREFDWRRKKSYRFLKYSTAIAFCVGICWPVADRLSPWRDRISGPTSLQVQEMALMKNIGPDFGLLEVFIERQKQMAQFRTALPTKDKE